MPILQSQRLAYDTDLVAWVGVGGDIVRLGAVGGI